MSSAAVTGEASSMPRQVDFLIRGMTRAARVERKLNAIDSVRATVNFATERVTVTAPASAPVLRLIEAVEQAGYGAEALARATLAVIRGNRSQPHRAAPGPVGRADGPGQDRVPVDGPEPVEPEEQMA